MKNLLKFLIISLLFLSSLHAGGVLNLDTDGDLIIDSIDLDDDNDGILDSDEGCTLITNGDFENGLNNWTAMTNWLSPIDNGTKAAANSKDSANNDQLSQTITNLNSGPITDLVRLSLDIAARNGNNVTAYTATLDILLGGTLYARLFNNTSNNTVSISTFNGATSDKTSIISTAIGWSALQSVVLTIPWVAQPDTALLLFDFSASSPVGDDFFIDNISFGNCDTDNDGIIDSLDLDSDNDGISDLIESGQNYNSVDSDNNGILDSITDADNDGLMSIVDADDNNATSIGLITLIDSDGDGIFDVIDLDADNDGIPDAVEVQKTVGYIGNDGNVSDEVNSSTGIILSGLHIPNVDIDDTADTLADYIDTDSDGDGLSDSVESGLTLSGNDSNADGIDD